MTNSLHPGVIRLKQDSIAMTNRPVTGKTQRTSARETWIGVLSAGATQEARDARGRNPMLPLREDLLPNVTDEELRLAAEKVASAL
jgi:plasmid replication initiation protein